MPAHRSAFRIAVLLVGMIGVVGSLAVAGTASAFFAIPFTSKAEAHGKLRVKLTKKFSLKLREEPTAVAWSPGGVLGVASSYGSTLNTYDGSGHPLSVFERNGSKGGAYSFAFLNDTQVAFPVDSAAKDDAAFDIREITTGKIAGTITRVDTDTYRPNGTDVFALSPNQKRLAIANRVSGQAIIYGISDHSGWHELAATKETEERHYRFAAVSLCFFPDNRRIAIGKTDGAFAIADSSTGETLKEFKAYDAPGVFDNIRGLAINPKGDLILTGLYPVAISPPQLTPEADAWEKHNDKMVSIWRIRDGKEEASFRDKGMLIRQAVWDPKNRFVAFVDTDSLIVWQPETPDQNYIRVKLMGGATSLAITTDGKLLAVAGGNNVTVYAITDN